MPSIYDVRHYLGGLWLILKGDARGLSAFDISDRGVIRSFWAFIFALPAYLIMWLDQKREHALAFPDTQETTFSFIAKSALVGIGDWLMPLLGLFAVLSLLRQRALFRTMVVVFNWWSLVAIYIGIAVLLTIILAPEPADEGWWTFSTYSLFGLIAIYFGLLFISLWRILRTVIGGSFFGRLTIVACMSLALYLLQPLEKQLGIYIP